MNNSSKILSNVIHYMKYAAYLPESKRRETFEETVTRNKEMHQRKFPYLSQNIESIYKDFVYNKNFLPAMRMLQFSGKAIEKNNARAFNCSYAPIDYYKVFSEAMFLLLSGVGFGYSVQFHHVNKLPKVIKPSKEKAFVIPDEIEGWADAVNELMKAFFGLGDLPIFDFSKIRKKGSRLITSGGKAPGPEPLKKCLKKIQEVLIEIASRNEDNLGTEIEPIDCHSILCHIADAVLAGGIRRASMIALFSFDDHKMRNCKSEKWYEINPHFARANNSAIADYKEITEGMFFEFWEGIKKNKSGEPGIYWTNNKNIGTNPCFAKDTKILSENGYVSIGDNVGVINLVNKNNEIVPGKIWSNGIKKIIKLTMDNKVQIKCTPEHIFLKQNGGEVKAIDSLYEEIKSFTDNVSVKVIRIDDIAEHEEVFDFSLDDDTHWGVVEGIIAHNCGEASLRPFSFCDLVEINGHLIENQDHFNKVCVAASFVNTLQAAYTDFTYLRDIWKKTTDEDALIGIGITGIASGRLENINLSEGAKLAKEENIRVSKLIGINPAARSCLIKPGGTSSIIMETTSGMKNWESEYFIRRARVTKTEPIYAYLKEKLPMLIEDEFYDPENTAVINFPQKAPENGILDREVRALDMFNRVKRFNLEWIRPSHNHGENFHNVSATVYLQDDEWDQAGSWLWENRNDYHGLTVLPVDNNSYKQLPFEPCSKEEYERLSQHLNNIDLTEIFEDDDLTNFNEIIACSGGACNII